WATCCCSEAEAAKRNAASNAKPTANSTTNPQSSRQNRRSSHKLPSRYLAGQRGVHDVHRREARRYPARPADLRQTAQWPTLPPSPDSARRAIAAPSQSTATEAQREAPVRARREATQRHRDAQPPGQVRLCRTVIDHVYEGRRQHFGSKRPRPGAAVGLAA